MRKVLLDYLSSRKNLDYIKELIKNPDDFNLVTSVTVPLQGEVRLKVNSTQPIQVVDSIALEGIAFKVENGVGSKARAL